MPDPIDTLEHPPLPAPRSYVVVARRYRPQTFADLIGQEHVAQALSNAITTQRVGHAYLFTGARGVGKTSAARILAKSLNCVRGPAPIPCNECDICRSIGFGDDVDVLEIDGASNRGIDEIRQLRQNVNVRPSRARFKIYIIDEVHMLTREAFNALLKTLEEPPEHVKFIFCTTEPTKIPITILSRCQRFDFAGISSRSIAMRLRQIVEAEGVQAETEALEVIARRAAGSMRDSQSLLEQLLAFAPQHITVADVHGMLGTAGDERLGAIVRHLVQRNPAGALAELETAIGQGVDAGLLIEQLFGYFRDCMLASVGCNAEAFLYAAPSRSEEVVEAARRLGLHTVLAMMQILDQALSRMRLSTQARILAELALVRICHLEDLDELAGLIEQLRQGLPAGLPSAARPAVSLAPPSAPIAPGATAKKNVEPPPPVAVQQGAAENMDSLPSAVLPLSAASVGEVWSRALERLSGMLLEQARLFDSVTLAAPNRLAVSFKAVYALARSLCQRPEHMARFERALADVTGQAVGVEFIVAEEGASDAGAAATVRSVPPHQRLFEAAKHPLLRRANELFGAQPTRVDLDERET